MNSSRRILTPLVSLLVLSALPASRAQQQHPAHGPRGFIRLMNAVAVGEGKLELLINGESVRDKGYEPGDITGGIPRAPAAYKVTIRRKGIATGGTKVGLVKDQTITLIPFAEQVPATEEREAYWRIRILRLKQQESGESNTATFVNLTRKPELEVRIRQPDDSWSHLKVKRLGLERTGILQSSGYVSLKAGDVDLKPLSVGSSGNFVAVIYEDASGKTCSTNFQDFKYLSLE